MGSPQIVPFTTMRINRFVAAASGLSRRAADATLEESRVSINGKLATLGQAVRPTDRVTLDGQILSLKPLQTIMLNKPVGYVTSRRQQGESPTIYALLPPELHHLKPVGRLDRESSGLLLLTNDGELSHRLQHPSAGKWKRYVVRLDRKLGAGDMERLIKGVKLTDGMSRLMVEATAKGYEVKLQEGRNRQIRRSFGALKYKVTYLHREALGASELDELASGDYKTVEV